MSGRAQGASEATDWTSYIEAARRKIAVADYHAERLRVELESAGYPGPGMPPIGVQACFEGVIIAVMAAIDQVCADFREVLG